MLPGITAILLIMPRVINHNQARDHDDHLYCRWRKGSTNPANKWQANDHERWLMSTPVGELAASELNPLVL